MVVRTGVSSADTIVVKHTWAAFDGRVPHWTRGFSGERFSLIFFTNSTHVLAAPEVAARLKRLGFPTATCAEFGGLEEAGAARARLEEVRRVRGPGSQTPVSLVTVENLTKVRVTKAMLTFAAM